MKLKIHPSFWEGEGIFGSFFSKVKRGLDPLDIMLFLKFVTLLFLLASCTDKSFPEIPGMVFISGGEKSIGSNTRDPGNLAKEYGSKGGSYFENEWPIHTVHLNDYYIDLIETSNSMYQDFILATDYPAPTHWRGTQYREGLGDHPVLNIEWKDADAFCRWAGKRLPTEEEWETAAKGPDGNTYPWGNDFDDKRANLNLGYSTRGGSMSGDLSYYGVYDMGGNVMEWTSSWYVPYPGSTFNSPLFAQKRRVIKGGYGTGTGHYKMGSYFSRGTFRNSTDPKKKGLDLGFRCVKETS